MVGFDCLQAMVFGADDLVVQPVLCILSCKQFTSILVLLRQVAAPESLDSYDFLFKFLLVRLELRQIVHQSVLHQQCGCVDLLHLDRPVHVINPVDGHPFPDSLQLRSSHLS